MAATNGAKKFLQHILAVAIEGGGFDKTLSKLRIVSGGKGRCIAEMRIEKEHTNRIGVLHGGFTAMLVDAVSTMALRTTEKAVPGISVDISVTYLRAAKTGEEIMINAETLKIGRSLAFLSVDITNKESGALIAKGSHTKFMG
ncbi:acyl-coenzyme A thioesterase 13 isoform X1 [Cherax quadricarinatus]|uniref:acyl-coenzyme A thioesterase 13 isoform X1 n=1 Tax=Cherax quadricarinatus TaxID=27406 RepID=UPI00387E2699